MDTTSLSIQKFIDESFGNQTILARALGIKPQLTLQVTGSGGSRREIEIRGRSTFRRKSG